MKISGTWWSIFHATLAKNANLQCHTYQVHISKAIEIRQTVQQDVTPSQSFIGIEIAKEARVLGAEVSAKVIQQDNSVLI